MFYHINYPQAVGGLQYLVFANHISPIELLIMPIYALFSSALTLLIVQEVALSLTGLIVYFVAKDLLKNEPIALALCFAYLVNPGMHGMILFDYHSEFLIIPLFLLVFYSYMKNKKSMLFIFLLLLLCVMEFTPILTLTLGMGLFLYEYRYDKAIDNALKKDRYKLIAVLVSASIISVAIYYGLYLVINSAYLNNAYPNLPPSLRLFPFYKAQVSTASTLTSSGGQSGLIIDPSHLFYSLTYPIYALAIVFLGFGITAFFISDIIFVLALPWLVEAFILGNSQFVDIWYHYFSFVVGGMLIAAILSLGILQKRENASKFIKSAPVIIICFSLLLLFYSQVFSLSKNIPSAKQEYYFEPYWYQSQINQLNYVVARLPSNASTLTNFFIASHLTQRKYLDVIESSNTTWFVPQYILIDFNENISWNAMSGSLNTRLNYTLILQNGSARLYELER
jgi:uncharacterized membrane protein